MEQKNKDVYLDSLQLQTVQVQIRQHSSSILYCDGSRKELLQPHNPLEAGYALIKVCNSVAILMYLRRQFREILIILPNFSSPLS